jgi:hypothetical protein
MLLIKSQSETSVKETMRRKVRMRFIGKIIVRLFLYVSRFHLRN